MTKSAHKILAMSLVIFVISLFSVPGGSKAIAQESQYLINFQPLGLEYAGIYALRRIEPNLTGEGVKFGVISRSITYIGDEPQNDYRPDIEHNCFSNNHMNFHDTGEPAASISSHSTSICSILFGEDPNAYHREIGPFHYQGIVPQANADIYEFWHFLTNNVFEQSLPDVDVITISIGNQFDDWWTRGIESLAENCGLIVVAGIGNGINAHDPLLYPGAGANIIGVGVINSVNTDDPAINLANFSLAYPEYSSFGPADDERCKPDIVAPGNCLAAKENEPNGYEPTGNFSSFSTPIVAGTIGILIQKAKQDPNLGLALSPEGGNCVIKSILLNSAIKLPYWHKGSLLTDDDHIAPLDNTQGAGMLNAVGAYEHLIAGPNKPGEVSTTGWDLNQLDKNKKRDNSYKVTIDVPAGKMITATAVWNKHYNNVYPFEPLPEKDSNLRLELWAIDPNDPSNDYLLDYSDSGINNVEHIYATADPNYTDYEIIISFSVADNQTATEPIQNYALAWNISDRQDNDNILWYDFNADGIVNDSDFTILLNNILINTKSPGSYLLGDINADGTIDTHDFEILLEHNNRRAEWYKQKDVALLKD